MHILITNDDGPPSPHSSPYVATLVSELKKAGHTVSVCLPHTQRSWIGKAHMIGQTVKPVYYRPSANLHGPDTEGTIHQRPTTSTSSSSSGSGPGSFDADAEWVLVDGTPASCVQIGLHHFFAERGPVDLVVSGPNYGRNTTAVFALSSGTLGGALEAAVCGKRAVALSYAFFSRNHDPDIIEGASRHGVRVIERLYADWPADGSVDLYSVNVPLVEGVEARKTLWAGMLQNYWREGSCFQEVDDVADEETEEERIREGAGGEVVDDAGRGGQAAAGSSDAQHQHQHQHHKQRHFKWAPRFADVYRSVEEAPPGNDGWAVKEGYTSVTPLKANFWHAATHLHQKELELAPRPSADAAAAEATSSTLPSRPKEAGRGAAPKFYAVIDYQDDYVQPLLLEAMEDLFPGGVWAALPGVKPADGGEPLALAGALPDPSARVLQITPYEAIDFEFAADHASSVLVNSYMIRKALIRKHYLSATVEGWVAKHPGSALTRGVRRSEHFEVDYAEFLDDALVEAFDLRESLDRNAEKPAEHREWWILKPGMSDRGQGIRLFSTMDELQGIFDAWEEERPDSDDEAEDDDGSGGGGGGGGGGGDYITTSHLRHFVAQPYIHPPLLVPDDGRKFHLRTYVLAVGCLQVYVYSDMLALFAAEPYAAPWESEDLDAHLTNTCLQGRRQEEEEEEGEGRPAPAPVPVRRLRDVGLAAEVEADVAAQIRALTGDVFEAAARGMTVHFQPQPNGFEAYGLDFLVGADGTAWLLEVNAFPDFRQSGEGAAGELRGVVAGFWREALRVAVGGFFGVEAAPGEAGRGRSGEEGRLELVREVDLGRR